MRQAFLVIAAVAVTLMRGSAQTPVAAGGLAQRIAHTDPATFRASPAVHGGANSMSFRPLLNRGALTPEFNFLHRGVIPAGASIGHHFHNVVEEMFVILDGEAQFTIDGRTATVKGPAGVICRAGHSHAIYNAGSAPVQWMNLNVSMVAGVYDAFDLGDSRVGLSSIASPCGDFAFWHVGQGVVFDIGEVYCAVRGFPRYAIDERRVDDWSQVDDPSRDHLGDLEPHVLSLSIHLSNSFQWLSFPEQPALAFTPLTRDREVKTGRRRRERRAEPSMSYNCSRFPSSPHVRRHLPRRRHRSPLCLVAG